MANSLNKSVEDKYLSNPTSTDLPPPTPGGQKTSSYVATALSQVGVVAPSKRFGRTELVKSANVSTRRPLQSIGIVIGDFNGLYNDELTLTVGERIEIISKDAVVSRKIGWWTGRNSHGQIGIFPATSVKVVTSVLDDFSQDEVDLYHHPIVIPSDEVQLGEVIGMGGFGEVYHALYKGEDVVVKIAHQTSFDTVKVITKVLSEAEKFAHLAHKNICAFVGVCLLKDVCLVMEYAHGGPLSTILHERNISLPIDIILDWSRQVSEGMEYLHHQASPSLIHCDLKSSNILLQYEVNPDNLGENIIKITGFGLAKEIENTTDLSGADSYPWMAPEAIRSSEFSKKSDVWSFGVVLWEILTGKKPYSGLDMFVVAYGVGHGTLTLPIPEHCPKSLEQLMSCCWKRQHSERPSFYEVLVTLSQIQQSEFSHTSDEEFKLLQSTWKIEIQEQFKELEKIETELEIKEKDLTNRMKIQEMRVEKMKKELEEKKQNLAQMMDKLQEHVKQLAKGREKQPSRIKQFAPHKIIEWLSKSRVSRRSKLSGDSVVKHEQPMTNVMRDLQAKLKDLENRPLKTASSLPHLGHKCQSSDYVLETAENSLVYGNSSPVLYHYGNHMNKRGTSLHLKIYENEAEQLSTYSSGYVSMNCSPRPYVSYSQDSCSMTPYIPGSSYDAKNLINLFDIITDIFGKLTMLEVTTSGLVHHCIQYGVTLIIPEGAIEHTANIWFGVCLFSDKFKFEDDYIPVSPIVWIYINCQLIKPAELYIPHHIDVSNMKDTNNQLYLLTADDEDILINDVFNFKQNYEYEVTVESTLVKVDTCHFCSNCIGVDRKEYHRVPKQYLIRRADKIEDNGHTVLVDYCLLYQQKKCGETLEVQYQREGYDLKSSPPTIRFTEESASIDFKSSIPGWYISMEPYTPEITKDSIDFYKVMDCTEGMITEKNIEDLKYLESLLSYPPRFRLRIEYDGDEKARTVVVLTFNGITSTCDGNPHIDKIVLKKPGMYSYFPPTPPSSDSSSDSSTSDVNIISKVTDPLIVDIMCILASKTGSMGIGDKWFEFGLKLGLTVGDLHNITMKYSGSLECGREAILLWRSRNMSASWEPITTALDTIGRKDLAGHIKSYFSTPPELQAQGHLTSHSITISEVKLQTVPSIADLNNLIGAKIEDKYHLFGAAVGLEEGYLNSLRTDYPTCQERFNQVFNKWSQTDPDSFIWSTVIKVLQSDTIRAHKIVENITVHLTS